jgi:hypothetical protein
MSEAYDTSANSSFVSRHVYWMVKVKILLAVQVCRFRTANKDVDFPCKLYV